MKPRNAFVIAFLTIACLTANCFTVESARAATVFNVTGTFDDATTLSGTLTIDVVAGLVVDSTVVNNAVLFSTIDVQQPFLGILYVVSLKPTPASTTPILNLGILGTSAPDSLVSYAGGILCSIDAPCGVTNNSSGYASDLAVINNGTTFIFLQNGALTPTDLVATPLPATLPLFASTVGVIGLLVGRKRRKHS